MAFQQPVQPPVRTAPKAAPAPKAREFSISKWKSDVVKTKRGYFSVTLPSGMIINDLVLQEKDGRRWINMPSKLGTDGQRYYPIIEFTETEIGNDFQQYVLAALDRHFTQLDEQKSRP